MSMMNSIEVARYCLDAIGRCDIAGWGEFMDTNVVLSIPFAPEGGFPKRVEGRANFLSTVTGIFENVKKFTWHDVKYYQTNDPEIVFITAKSEVDTVNGKPYANEYVIMMQVRNGLVLEHREYFNPLPVMSAFM